MVHDADVVYSIAHFIKPYRDPEVQFVTGSRKGFMKRAVYAIYYYYQAKLNSSIANNQTGCLYIACL